MKNKIYTLTLITILLVSVLSVFSFALDDNTVLVNDGGVVSTNTAEPSGFLDRLLTGLFAFVNPKSFETSLSYRSNKLSGGYPDSPTSRYGNNCEAGDYITLLACTGDSSNPGYCTRMFNKDYLKTYNDDLLDVKSSCVGTQYFASNAGGDCYAYNWYQNTIQGKYVGYDCKTRTAVGTPVCFPEGDRLCTSGLVQVDGSILCDTLDIIECECLNNACVEEPPARGPLGYCLWKTRTIPFDYFCARDYHNDCEGIDGALQAVQFFTDSDSCQAFRLETQDADDFWYCLSEGKNMCFVSSQGGTNCYETSEECNDNKEVTIVDPEPTLACSIPFNWNLVDRCGVARTKQEYKELDVLSENEYKDKLLNSFCDMDANCIIRDGYNVSCVKKEIVEVENLKVIWLADLFMLVGADEPGLCFAHGGTATEASTFDYCREIAEPIAFMKITGKKCTDGTLIIFFAFVLLLFMLNLMKR